MDRMGDLPAPGQALHHRHVLVHERPQEQSLRHQCRLVLHASVVSSPAPGCPFSPARQKGAGAGQVAMVRTDTGTFLISALPISAFPQAPLQRFRVSAFHIGPVWLEFPSTV